MFLVFHTKNLRVRHNFCAGEIGIGCLLHGGVVISLEISSKMLWNNVSETRKYCTNLSSSVIRYLLINKLKTPSLLRFKIISCVFFLLNGIWGSNCSSYSSSSSSNRTNSASWNSRALILIRRNTHLICLQYRSNNNLHKWSLIILWKKVKCFDETMPTCKLWCFTIAMNAQEFNNIEGNWK